MIGILPRTSWNPRRAVLADTGSLYAAADPTDQHHDRARAELGRLAAAGLAIFVARSTLLEAHRLGVFRRGSRQGLIWLDDLLSGVTLVDPVPEDFAGAIERLHRYPDQSLTGSDAALAVVGARLSLPIWTFDHHFDVMQVNVWRP